MNANNFSINVSLLGGWGANNFDVRPGVVDAGGQVVQVHRVACCHCEKLFRVGESVAVVYFDDALQAERIYHMECLPVEFGFACPTPPPEMTDEQMRVIA